MWGGASAPRAELLLGTSRGLLTSKPGGSPARGAEAPPHNAKHGMTYLANKCCTSFSFSEQKDSIKSVSGNR